MNQAQRNLWGSAGVVSVYTRAQAIDDGVLVDVGEMAREAGFRVPVAVTRTVWERYIVPDDRARKWGQAEGGRLWDLLWMLRHAASRASGRPTVFFRVVFILKERQRRVVRLKAVCGPGDDLEPVITVMLPDED